VAHEKKTWRSSVFGGEVAGGWKNQTNWNSFVLIFFPA
jgi:hypothetical protein